ncbi:MAG TPA: NAD(P)-dependent alcohol dehydrogenase [Candidatus Limnocylindrales bacterium]|nr:NAD(P)-dependent alcohol dehydrogenase [Candidatus Limnocylindrales bacterium]
MKAIVQTSYGSPDVLHLQEVARPVPNAGEVLIRVRTASLTPSDGAFRKGEPFIVRILYGLRKPRLSIGGVEFSGDVIGVGEGVTDFRAADAVFGMSPDHFGAHAEYLCLPVKKTLIHKPSGMSYEAATALADGAATALTFLRDVAKVQPGQTVLINGASGAVGAAAVQLAKHFGAEVTGVCSTANVEMVKALGANHVIDYTRADFTRSGQTWDVIFDAVGKSSFRRCSGALTPRGIYMTTVPGLGIVAAILRTSFGNGKKAKFTTAGLKQNKDNLKFLAGLFEAGKIEAVIDRRFPLEAMPDAHRYVDTGHKKGNVIIMVAA